MARIVAAMDKYKGTASAAELSAALQAAGEAVGWQVDVVPMADGGEGLAEVFGGQEQRCLVTGPLNTPVEARWHLVDSPAGPLAVIESAAASGLVLAGGAARNDPEAATTKGTGELIAAALDAGCRRVLVGCGGSATTDGGKGAVDALVGRDLSDIDLLVAADVTTPFLDAAAVFGPQKGANPAAVVRLTGRLVELAATYRDRFDIDVTTLAGAGAAGGLAGGLACLGGRIASGFDLVAELVGLDEHLRGADLVITGEGCLDRTSLVGKVVGGVVARVPKEVPVLVIVGVVDDSARIEFSRPVRVVSLVERFGTQAALGQPAKLVGAVLAELLAAEGELQPR
ncbi:MAG: glycerate kinase [Actinomycetota bacterium]|jgi:glycerate kinase|nr:glycerate kinase [Actinomycetota bacterium]